MLLGSEMKFVRRKKFVKKNSRSHHSRSRDLDSRRIMSFLRKMEEHKELILTIVKVIIGTVSMFLSGRVLRST